MVKKHSRALFFLCVGLSFHICRGSHQPKVHNKVTCLFIESNNKYIVSWLFLKRDLKKLERFIISDVIFNYHAFLVNYFSFKSRRHTEVVSQMCILTIYGHSDISDPPCEDMFKAIKLCYIRTHRRLDVVRTSYLSLLTVICGFLFGFLRNQITMSRNQDEIVNCT